MTKPLTLQERVLRLGQPPVPRRPSRLAAWIAERIEGQEETDVPTIVNDAIEHFGGDTAVVRRTLGPVADQMADDVKRARFAEVFAGKVREEVRRTYYRPKADPLLWGDKIVSRNRMKGIMDTSPFPAPRQ